MAENFSPLHVGQRVRVTKKRHIPGRPVLSADAWVDDITEGQITKFKRIEGGVLLAVSPAGSDPAWINIRRTPLSLLLNHDGQKVEILEAAPDQGRLFSQINAAERGE